MGTEAEGAEDGEDVTRSGEAGMLPLCRLISEPCSVGNLLSSLHLEPGVDEW